MMRRHVMVSGGLPHWLRHVRATRYRRGRPRLVVASALCLVAAGLATVTVTSQAQGATTPAGFSESVVFSGLTNPTVLRFSPDGRIFVAEKRGVIKVFDSLSDSTPEVFADLNVNVHNFWDRGLLGMTLDPGFPANPYVYVLYTYDHELGSSSPAPRWGTPGVYSDPCPTPPGATADGCVVSGRLSRLTASGNVMTGSEQVLVEDWCQQYPSHSVGSVEFGRSGALYASAGDGASFNFADWGQDGSPLNPCGDPPGGAGAVLVSADRGGRGAAQPGPPHLGRPGGSGRHRDPRRPGHRSRAADEPAGVVDRPQRPPHRRPRTAQPVPGDRAARHRRALDRRRRDGTTGRRSTASCRRPPRSATSAGRATRASAGRPATTAPTSTSARRSTPRPAP